MSAITAALRQLDDVAAEGDLAPEALPADALGLEAPSDPIILPDGKPIYPPTLHGERVDALALALLDMADPARSSFCGWSGRPARARARSPARSPTGSGPHVAGASKTGTARPST